MDYQTLNTLFRYSKEFSHERIKTRDLSDTECMICSYIYSHDKCSQDDVACALKADKTTIGKAIASLEKKNYVRREKDPLDKRINRLSLCDDGRDQITDLLNMHNEWLADIMTCLTGKEQEQFQSYCERLIAAAENKLNKTEGNKFESEK